MFGAMPRDHNPVAEHDGFGQRGDPNDPLVGCAARALRSILTSVEYADRAVSAGILSMCFGVLVLRGENDMVREGLLAVIREVVSFPMFRDAVLDVEDSLYNLIRVVVRTCVRKVLL